MFSNAGITSTCEQDILNFDMSAYEKLFAINVRGMVASVKHAAHVMVDGGIRGSIVCTASMVANKGIGKYIDYTMSKHAVLGIMRSASSQLGAYGIRVNCVSPGPVATPLLCNSFRMSVEEVEKTFEPAIILKGGGGIKAEHVAEVVLFLASSDSAFVTGQNIVVDGGYKF